MHIFVKTLGEKSLNLEVDQTTSIQAIKAQIEDVEFIPVALQRLTFACQQLTTGSLESFGIKNGDSINLLMNVVGGMRAKWRKKRMRRLKRKRRKMRRRAQ